MNGTRPDTPAVLRPPERGRAGQVLPLALAAILVLAVAALLLADFHHAIRVRNKTQDAGDAAALEAARWQGMTLNLAGELNAAMSVASAALRGAVARGEGGEGVQALSNAVEAIENVSARLLFAGPLTGFAAAQQAAKLNGAPDNPAFAELLRDHVRDIRALSRSLRGGEDDAGSVAREEPWPGAWDAYATALSHIAASGVAAGPDNAEFFGAAEGDHILLKPGFYLAVNGFDWCWFHWNAPDLPGSYRDFRSWPPLPEALESRPPQNSEFLSVHLRHEPIRGAQAPAGKFLRYDPEKWGDWAAIKEPGFPITGTLRPESDYAGADVAMRVENPLERISGEVSGGVSLWTAAAKPFGYLETESGGRLPPTAAPSLVVTPGAFRNVGLVPLDAVLASGAEAFDRDWNEHRLRHLRNYLLRGVPGLTEAGFGDNCLYCRILCAWDTNTVMRLGQRKTLPQEAADWLSTNSWRCTITSGGGRGGGTGHAH